MRWRLSALCCWTFALPLFAEDSITHLEPGAAPAQSAGEVSGFAFRTYRFSARAGQYYRVELDNPDVEFSLLPRKRGNPIPSGNEGYIPADGEYELRILQSRDAAQSGQKSAYRLTLTVNDQHSDKADAASRSAHIHFTTGSISVNESGRLQGKAEDSYRFFANRGQRLHLDLQGDNLLASLHYLGRENPELDPREQILPLGGQYELRLSLNRAAQRRNKIHDYRFTLSLSAAQRQTPASSAPAAASANIATPAAPAANTSVADSAFVIQYRCALDTTLRIHYGELASAEPRASVYLNDNTYHLAQSTRHSTPAQAVFYGRKHYLVLTAPRATRQSNILRFEKRDGEEATVLAADCKPQ